MIDYKSKYKKLFSFAKDLIHINCALSDEVSKVNQKISKIDNEKLCLLKELLNINPTLRRELLNNTDLFGNDKIKESGKLKKTEIKKHRKIKKPKTSLLNMPEYLPSKPKRSSKSSKKSTSQSSSITSLIKEGAVEKASLVPLDFQGRPLFPVKLENDSLIVFSIGEISPLPSFHSQSLIYPVGYCSTRLYQSINPTGLSSIDTPSIDACLYTCKVSEAAGKPKFEIISEDCTGITFVGTSPDDCCNKLSHTMSQFWDNQTTSIDGGWFFGLSHPTIKNFIQSMPGAKKCTNYQWVKYEIVKKETEKKDLISYGDSLTSKGDDEHIIVNSVFEDHFNEESIIDMVDNSVDKNCFEVNINEISNYHTTYIEK